MTFVIAAAGTGGHVFPGLSVGQALVERGVPLNDILYIGGNRLEAEVYPAHGFPFLQIELRGLQRSLTMKNIGIPAVVARARRTAVEAMTERGARVVLGLGGYVTVPIGLAARSLRLPFFNAEQNATAGLANRVASRWARRTFGAFPVTEGLPTAVWVGNPVRRQFWDYDRERFHLQALERYHLSGDLPVLGVFGGSLGAGVINEAIVGLVERWDGPPLQVVHLTGQRFEETPVTIESAPGVNWQRQAFESEMEWFYGAADLVVARAGGGVAELTATGTPAILVPGEFGSGGHQIGNARFLAESGAAIVLPETQLHRLPRVVADTLFDTSRLGAMRNAAADVARPLAALTIAEALLEAAL